VGQKRASIGVISRQSGSAKREVPLWKSSEMPEGHRLRAVVIKEEDG
jgi:hypothetical protein